MSGVNLERKRAKVTKGKPCPGVCIHRTPLSPILEACGRRNGVMTSALLWLWSPQSPELPSGPHCTSQTRPSTGRGRRHYAARPGGDLLAEQLCKGQAQGFKITNRGQLSVLSLLSHDLGLIHVRGQASEGVMYLATRLGQT